MTHNSHNGFINWSEKLKFCKVNIRRNKEIDTLRKILGKEDLICLLN